MKIYKIYNPMREQVIYTDGVKLFDGSDLEREFFRFQLTTFLIRLPLAVLGTAIWVKAVKRVIRKRK